MTEWAGENFGEARRGDKRLEARLVKVMAGMMSKAGASIAEQFGANAAELAGAYRLINNKRIMPELLLSAHREKTLEKCRAREVILCVQDTTELDVTGSSLF